MKNIKIIGLLCLLGLMSCDADIVDYGTSKQDITIPSPYIQLVTPVVSFQAGTPSYEVAFNAINSVGNLALNSVIVHSTYTDASSGEKSESVLGTYSVGDGKTAIAENLTYDDLKSGHMIAGSALPDDQTLLAVGSGWTFSFEGARTDGSTVDLRGAIVVSVLSRFAGFYKVLESAYFRIGVESSLTDWTGQTRFIGSVDENTFSHVDSWGPFLPADGAVGQFVFDVNPDNSITVLDHPSQLFFSGSDMLTCQDDPGSFTNVPCSGSNKLVPDDATGKHVIFLTYGYEGSGGPREFYEKMEKIVN